MSVRKCIMTQPSLDTVRLECSRDAAVWKDPGLKQDICFSLISGLPLFSF